MARILKTYLNYILFRKLKKMCREKHFEKLKNIKIQMRVQNVSGT